MKALVCLLILLMGWMFAGGQPKGTAPHKDVIRSLDLRQPENGSLNAIQQGDPTSSLKDMLINAVLNKKLQAFSDPFQLDAALSQEEILARLKDTGTTLQAVWVSELWLTSPTSKRMTVQFRGIAPVISSHPSGTSSRGKALFWCSYPEAIALMKQYSVTSPYDTDKKVPLAAYFQDRFLNSEVLTVTEQQEDTASFRHVFAGGHEYYLIPGQGKQK